MKHFKLQEFFHSATASAYDISNNATSDVHVENIFTLVDYLLDPLRDKLGSPILITSGYRTPELNEEIGGAPNSQHTIGRAVDIRPVIGKDTYYPYGCVLRNMFQIIVNDLDFDQVIYYPKRGFIHVSYVSVSANRHSVIIKR